MQLILRPSCLFVKYLLYSAKLYLPILLSFLNLIEKRRLVDSLLDLTSNLLLLYRMWLFIEVCKEDILVIIWHLIPQPSIKEVHLRVNINVRRFCLRITTHWRQEWVISYYNELAVVKLWLSCIAKASSLN